MATRSLSTILLTMLNTLKSFVKASFERENAAIVTIVERTETQKREVYSLLTQTRDLT